MSHSRKTDFWTVRFPKIVKLRTEVDWREPGNHVLGFDELQETAEIASKFDKPATSWDHDSAIEKVIDRMPLYAKAAQPYINGESYTTTNTNTSTHTGEVVSPPLPLELLQPPAPLDAFVLFDSANQSDAHGGGLTSEILQAPTEISSSQASQMIKSPSTVICMSPSPIPLSMNKSYDRGAVLAPRYDMANRDPMEASSSLVCPSIDFGEESPSQILSPHQSLKVPIKPMVFNSTDLENATIVPQPQPGISSFSDDLLCTLDAFMEANYSFGQVTALTSNERLRFSQACKELQLNIVSPVTVLYGAGCGVWVTQRHNGVLLVEGKDEVEKLIEWALPRMRYVMLLCICLAPKLLT
ncbi:hypothetical protein HDU93_005181 [Gonapodya sp. JEL0774]|nr:hypothetical protein HDU93_005181 [Gonapodya sp. JEL0774]